MGMDDADVMGSMDSDEEEDATLPKISLPEEQAKPSQKDLTKDAEPDNEEINDPWLAVKPEYKRKDSTSSEKESDAREEGGYTIQVKVTTKETARERDSRPGLEDGCDVHPERTNSQHR